jgi:hypothetical protein
MSADPSTIVIEIRRRIVEQEQYLAILHRDRDVDGYLAACQAFNSEMAGHVKTLVNEIERLNDQTSAIPTLLEHINQLTKTVNEAPEFLEAVRIATSADNVQLRAALTEALDLFDATWCPEHGHAPKPEQLARAAELRKLTQS